MPSPFKFNTVTARFTPGTPFRLTRWFIALAALAIALIALLNTWAISRFLSEQLFQREAAITRDFVQNVLISDGSFAYLEQPQDPAALARFQESVLHLSNMEDVVRANVYTRERVLLWSSDARLSGQHFEDNEELEEALRGELVVHAGQITPDERDKGEHVGLPASANFYVETYIPIYSPRKEIVGVVELYKAPVALTKAIEAGHQQIALIALASALVLFLSLYALVRRADRVMQRQHAQLLEGETLAVMGELAASVAHNVRNPLASIRSAAELTLESPEESPVEAARDILHAVDRVSERIHELLRLAALSAAPASRLHLLPFLSAFVVEQEAVLARKGQHLVLQDVDPSAHVVADAQLLKHMLQSLLSNASEAMGEGGQASLEVLPGARGQWALRLHDRGHGLPTHAAADVMRPFFTTKSQGLGLGLPLARRIVERFGGRLSLAPRAGGGTTVTIALPQA